MDFSGATVLTLGDVMLERFAYCRLERISPEAPVPVLLVGAEDMTASGGRVALIDLVEGRSASKVIGRLQASEKVG
jgi:D-beta-D-heptose 7-phosphate kinase / D-beta-D-heptose 1-phosphate adenosyltransferase